MLAASSSGSAPTLRTFSSAASLVARYTAEPPTVTGIRKSQVSRTCELRKVVQSSKTGSSAFAIMQSKNIASAPTFLETAFHTCSASSAEPQAERPCRKRSAVR